MKLMLVGPDDSGFWFLENESGMTWQIVENLVASFVERRKIMGQREHWVKNSWKAAFHQMTVK